MSTWDVIVNEASKFGVPLDILSPIIYQESRGKASASQPGGGGRGLLQLDVYGGQGRGFSDQQLFDPTFNLEHGLPYIQAAYRRGLQLGYSGQNLLDYTASHSGHASQTPLSDTSIRGGDPSSYLQAINQWFSEPGHGVSMLQGAAGGGGGSVPVLGGIEHYGGNIWNAYSGSFLAPWNAPGGIAPGPGSSLPDPGKVIKFFHDPQGAAEDVVLDIGKRFLPYILIGVAMLVVFIKLLGELGAGDQVKTVAVQAARSPVK